MYFPGKEEVERLRVVGWERIALNIPPGVKEILAGEAEYQGRSMSRLIWATLVGLYLKTHDYQKRTLPELAEALREHPEIAEEGHKRFAAVTKMAEAEEKRVHQGMSRLKAEERMHRDKGETFTEWYARRQQ